MAKQSPTTAVEKTDQLAWSVRARAIVSILLVLHLTAIFAAPWSGPPPASRLSRTVVSCFAPYLHSAYLLHGYRFFAPDPGPSHIVRYELLMPDDSVKQGHFPDLEQHFPRLLYHRHFMLSETVFRSLGIPLEDAAELQRRIDLLRPAAESLRQAGELDGAGRLDAQIAELTDTITRMETEADMLARARQSREALLTPIARDLLRRHGAKRVRLYAVTHLIPSPVEVLGGMPLDDEQLYRPVPLGEFSEEEETP